MYFGIIFYLVLTIFERSTCSILAITFLGSLTTVTPSVQLVSQSIIDTVSCSSSDIPRLVGSSTDRNKKIFSAAFLRTTGYLKNNLKQN